MHEASIMELTITGRITIFARAIFLLLLMFSTNWASAQKLSKSVLDSIRVEIEELIGFDWFLTPTESGFTISFCRSCHEEYISSVSSPGKYEWPNEPSRGDFFDLARMDSICYLGCCYLGFNPDDSEAKLHRESLERYKANGVMSFEVSFEKKWKEEKYLKIQSQNELLKEEILKTPLYKTDMDIFSDFRFFLPWDDLRDRTTKFDFYFERLPYTSEFLDCSIFIIPNKPFGAIPIYVDKRDPYYYRNESNRIESELSRTLKMVALALGIRDYKLHGMSKSLIRLN